MGRMKIPGEPVQIDHPGAWIQVVHCGNVSNRVRGRVSRTHAMSKSCGASRRPRTCRSQVGPELWEIDACGGRLRKRGIGRFPGREQFPRQAHARVKRIEGPGDPEHTLRRSSKLR